MRNKFSVCIATNNRPKMLKKTLNSLTRQLLIPSEVTIIDTSNLPQKVNIQDYFKLLNIHYKYKKGLNIPQARTACLKSAKYNLVLLLDDDCQAPKTWTKKLIEAYEKNKDVTLISGRFIHYPKGSIYSIIIDALREKRINLSKNTDQIYINIGNSLINRSKIIKNGIKFDLSMKREEDLDFAIRIIKKGLKIIYLDDVVVYHSSRSNLKSFLYQRFQNAGNVIRLKKRWGNYFLFMFGAKSSSYLPVYLTLAGNFLKKGKIVRFLELTGVTALSTATYISGYIYAAIKNYS